ncbi:MAG: restriction endonuclease subunit S [Planctomycetes bacterium]|nr:restriction endonuclease subunit S [Planctomycetota bacterium]
MKSDTYVASGVPVIRGNNISDTKEFVDDFVFITAEFADRLRSQNVRDGDLVFPHRGNIGTVGIVGKLQPRYVLSTSLMKLTCNRSLAEPLFLFYFFRSPAGHHKLMEHASTVGTPGIGSPLTSLRSIEVNLPPLHEQQAIACILGVLDDKIELNRRRNRTLEAMARAIFQSWFVDFDPVRAKADGRALAGLSPDLAALFPDSFEESALGPIPKGWRVRPLPEVFEINPTRTLAKGSLAPYLDMANMPTQGPSPESWVMRETGSGMKFINGDTLVARITPCLENGKTAFVDFLRDGEVGWGSTEYIVLRPKKGIPPIFAYLLARTQDFRAFAIQQMTGSSGRQRVPADSLDKYSVATPDNDSPLFTRFGGIVSPVFSQITAAVEQSRTLAALRDALLPKLISGELRVPDAERIVGRAT